MRPVRVTDTEWAQARTAQLPNRWRLGLLASWERQRRRFDAADWRNGEEAQRQANARLLEVTQALDQVRIPLDAGDSTVCARAEEMANRCGELAQVFHDAAQLRQAMARLAEKNGAQPPGRQVEDGPAMARMVDPLWWRRQLRKLHARAVEGAAIHLGYVNRTRDLYVSEESMQRRLQQNQRNAQTLEATRAINEQGQEFTLAELAAKGPANKRIRRAELMTRIAGFERIARDLGHAGLFFTVTCPSRMHKWRTVSGGRVIENPRYDGTTPTQAQGYLASLWARIRAALARQDVRLYGFRIAEPNHDGTPHWHLLVFHPVGQLDNIKRTLWHYALQDSPDEPGAQQHRLDIKPIDWSKGSAAGYIAKYVAKNIDGMHVGQDLYGNDAMHTSARVEAWAATWRIRQFQQIGGPPVTIWRELRRVREVPDNAPEHLKQAHRAVNKVAKFEGREHASVAWDHYCQAQGGVLCGRGYRIRLATKKVEDLGRYGEPIGPRPIGVETIEREFYTPAHMAWMGGQASRLVHWVVESARHVWRIVAARSAEVFRGALRPWTCVNNCTENPCGQEARTTSGPAGRVGEGTLYGQSGGGGLHHAPAGPAGDDAEPDRRDGAAPAGAGR